MKFYYMTKTKGKCGVANTVMHVTDNYETKAEVKKAKKTDRTSVKGVWTEAEVAEAWGENAQKIIAEAKPW